MCDTLPYLIRQIIKEVSEEEQLLKKWTSAKKNNDLTEYENILVDMGMTLIPSGKQNYYSFLGEGIEAEAYEVLWKGKRAVAKVSFEKSSIKQTSQIYELSKTFPPRYRKHIMKVLDFGKVPENLSKKYFDTGEGEYDHHWYVVVEYLEPIPNSLVNDVYGTSSTFAYIEEKNDSITDEMISAVIKKVIDVDIKKDSNILKDLSKFVNTRIKNNIIKQIHAPSPTIEKAFKGKVKNLLLLANMSSSLYEVEYYADRIKDEMHRLMFGARFPKNARDEKDWGADLMKNHQDPRIRSLVNFLIYLKKEHNIYWNDLHSANIMMRPKTKDLVICDVGHFGGI